MVEEEVLDLAGVLAGHVLHRASDDRARPEEPAFSAKRFVSVMGAAFFEAGAVAATFGADCALTSVTPSRLARATDAMRAQTRLFIIQPSWIGKSVMAARLLPSRSREQAGCQCAPTQVLG
jgi:hypothetical protein